MKGGVDWWEKKRPGKKHKTKKKQNVIKTLNKQRNTNERDTEIVILWTGEQWWQLTQEQVNTRWY